MHLIITDAWLAKSRAIYLSGTKVVVVALLAALGLMVVSAGLYHWVFLRGARDGWLAGDWFACQAHGQG